jgi:Glycosyltransferase family 9 (heptosyltransferase)
MSYVSKEYLAVISRETLAAGNEIPRQGLQGELWHSVERRQTLLEVHQALLQSAPAEVCADFAQWVATLRAQALNVDIVPLPRRFYYAWFVVALGDSEALMGLLQQALNQTDPAGSGLVLTKHALATRPAHVEVIDPSTAPEFSANPSALVQLARFIVGSYPAARLLCCDGLSAAALADLYGQHAVGVVLESASAGLEESQSPLQLNALLQQLARGEASSPQRGWARGAGTWLTLDNASRVRAKRDTASVLSWSSSSAASFLSPEKVYAAIDRPASASPEGAQLGVSERLLGSNRPRTGRRVAFASLHLLGDTLAATAVLRAQRAARPDDHISFLAPDRAYARILELCPGIDRVGYVQMPADEQIIYGSSRRLVESLEWWTAGDFDDRHVLDIQEAASSGRGAELHMSEIYALDLGLKLADRRPWVDTKLALEHRPVEAPDEPYVVFARHTVSGKHVAPSHENTKRWHERKWVALAERIRRQLGLRVVSIGTPAEGRMEHPDVLDLHELDIREVAGLLAGARALISVDNGVFHLGLGLGTTLVHLQPKWLPSSWTASALDGPYRDIHAVLPKLGVEPVFRTLEELLAVGQTAQRP